MVKETKGTGNFSRWMSGALRKGAGTLEGWLARNKRRVWQDFLGELVWNWLIPILFESVPSAPFDKLRANGECNYLLPLTMNLSDHR